MRMNLVMLLTLALALVVGCSKNQAGNSNSSSGSNPSADNSGATGTTGSADNSSAGQSGTSAKLSDSEKQLLQKVAAADKAEIEMGQLAQSNGSSDNVKQLGQKLVDDHTQNSQQLQQIAQQKGVQLEDQEKPDEQSMKTKMEKMKGAQFDKAFLQHERDDHAKLLKELQQQQDQVQDPDVKSFLTQTISAVQQHLQATQGAKASSTSPSGQ
jgi:putative membrane protein